jgi:hypothetical protein
MGNTVPHPPMKSFFATALPLCLLIYTAEAQQPEKPAPTGKAAFVAAGEKLFSKLEEFSIVLATAKDAPTAEVAKTKLVKINKEIETLSKAAAALGEPPPELENDPKMRQRAEAIMNKLVPLTQRIAADPVILPILQQTLKDFQRASSGGAAPPPTPTPAKPDTSPAKPAPAAK